MDRQMTRHHGPKTTKASGRNGNAKSSTYIATLTRRSSRKTRSIRETRRVRAFVGPARMKYNEALGPSPVMGSDQLPHPFGEQSCGCTAPSTCQSVGAYSPSRLTQARREACRVGVSGDPLSR